MGVLKQSSYELAKKIDKYIDENYMEFIDGEVLAKQFYFTSGWIKLCYKRVKGITPMQYLTNVRMFTAAQLIERNDIPLKDVSYSVGYQSHSTFCQAFKRRYGITMSEYRAAIQREKDYRRGKKALNGDVSKSS